LLYHAPLQGKSACRLVTLLAATRDEKPAFDITEDDTGVIRVAGDLGLSGNLSAKDEDLSIRAEGSSMEIRCGDVPALPEALGGFTAKDAKGGSNS